MFWRQKAQSIFRSVRCSNNFGHHCVNIYNLGTARLLHLQNIFVDLTQQLSQMVFLPENSGQMEMSVKIVISLHIVFVEELLMAKLAAHVH